MPSLLGNPQCWSVGRLVLRGHVGGLGRIVGLLGIWRGDDPGRRLPRVSKSVGRLQERYLGD